MALKINRTSPKRMAHVKVAEPTHRGFSVDVSGDLDHGEGNGFEPDRNRTYEAKEHEGEGGNNAEPKRSETYVASDFEAAEDKPAAPAKKTTAKRAARKSTKK